nr:hypothetical protein [Tanacetum cinerariifolium]
MSTQQDIYAAGSENHPHMLNKENYVPWSSRLLWYAKSRPNGKLIHNTIINGPYVRRMIPEPANDQAIQTILLSLPEDIYAAIDSCENAQEIWLRVQQMMKGSDIGIQEKKAKLFNEWERQITQPGMNMGQDRQMQMVGGNGRNQFRQNARQNVGNLNGYNDVQNVGNQVIQNVVQNPRIQNVKNQNGLIGVPWNANQNLNRNGNLVAARAEVRPRRRDAAYLQTQLLIAQKEEAGIQLQPKEFDLMAAAADLDEIEEVNANCILIANLQQASTLGTQKDKAPVYDSDGLAEIHNYKNCYDNEIFNMFTQEEQYTELLEPIPKPHQVPQNDNNVISEVSSVEQNGETVEQHPTNVEETRVVYDSLYNNLAIEVEKVNTSIARRLKLLEASGSASRQAQLSEHVVGQYGLGGSGVDAVIGLSADDGAGVVGCLGFGVGSQGSSHSRWEKKRAQTERISPQKRTPTQLASQPSTNPQVPMTKTRNADGREMGDGIPT